MMAVDSLHVPVHLIVPSGMSFRWSSRCRRACSACAFAPHFAQHPAPQRILARACALASCWRACPPAASLR